MCQIVAKLLKTVCQIESHLPQITGDWGIAEWVGTCAGTSEEWCVVLWTGGGGKDDIEALIIDN